MIPGQLDVLVNNVGTNRRRQAEDASAKDFDVMMVTNVRSAPHLCQLQLTIDHLQLFRGRRPAGAMERVRLWHEERYAPGALSTSRLSMMLTS